MNNAAQDFVQSLSPALPNVEANSEDTTTDSQTETETEELDEEDNGNGEGGEEEGESEEDKKAAKPEVKKKSVPFHKHPRWIERERQWEARLEEMKEATAKEIEGLKSQIGNRQAEHKELTEDDIPEWFNGDLATYKKFHAHQTNLIKAAVKEAEENWTQKFKGESEQQNKAIEEATKWFRSEVARIEADEELNPDGESIDQQALLKIAKENDLTDSKGRWNWAAAYRIYAKERAATKTEEPEVDEEEQKEKTLKKNIAAITSKKNSKSNGSQKRIESADSLKNMDW